MTIRDKWLYIMKNIKSNYPNSKLDELWDICDKNPLLRELYNADWGFDWINDEYYTTIKPTKEFVLLVNLVYKMKNNDNS